MRRLSQFLSLSGQEKRIFLTALILLPPTVVAIRLAGFRGAKTFLGWLVRPSPACGAASGSPGRAREVANIVAKAARHGVITAGCLPRVLLTQRLLQRQGVECSIRFGVLNNENEFNAHAWLECSGVRIDEKTPISEGFVRLETALDGPGDLFQCAERLEKKIVS